MKEEETDVVEIDAIGAEEWERDQHTPQAIESNLAALVKQSASSNSGPVRAKTVDDEWGDPVPAAPEKPRTTTNTLRRTQAMGTPIVKPQVPGVSIGKLALERPRTEPGAAKPPTSAKASGQMPALGRASTQVPAISKGSAQITAKRPATQTNTEVADPPPARVATNTVARKDATPVPATKSAVGDAQTAPRKDATPVPASARTSSAVEAQPRKDATPAPVTARTTTGAAKPAAVEAQTAPRKEATPAPATARTTTGAAKPAAVEAQTAPRKDATPAPATARTTTGAAAAKPAVTQKDATTGPKDWRDVPATPAKPPATPARKDSTPLPATANKTSTRNDATPVLGMKSIVEAQLAARQVAAASTLDLPAWPPQAGSQHVDEPTTLPPPPPFEDWEDDGKYPDKPLPKRTRDEIAHDFKDEDSIIIDLGAKPKLDDDSERRRRPQSYPVIQTSEQSSTTSGVFVMPTAAVPNATAPAIGATHETNPFAQAIKTNPLVAEFAPVETAAAALPYGTNPFPAPPAQHPAESPFAASTSPGGESLDFAASTNPLATQTNPFAVAARTSTASAWNTPLPAQLPDQPAAVPPTWPSASNLADINSFASTDDLAIPTQLPHVEKTAPARVRGLAFLGSAERRRSIAIVAGGSIALFLVLILAFGGSSSKARATAPATKTQATPTAVASTVATSQKPAAATLAAVASATETDADPSSSPTAKSAPTSKQPIAKRRYFKAKKPVVVDYDKSNDPTASKDEALARARVAYAAGNQHLFAGEADAAVSSYKQALADYPSYVAGYRGLGLAYAQQNNRPAALAAFKTYVKLAPTAKDVALIEKRIRNLSVAH